MSVSEGGDPTLTSKNADPTASPEPPAWAAPNGAETAPAAKPKSLYRRLFTRRYQVVLAVCSALLLALWAYIPPVYKLISGPVTVTRYDRHIGATKAVVGPGLKGWISTAKISRHALHAVIAEEDGRFYEHHGFDFDEMRKSYLVNVRKKHYARGGSTISQQVVKMAFLSRDKTVNRKVREALGTALMELILTKDDILEWYINMAEFGDGVYGIEEGCWHYFKTKPEQLTVAQAVHLALVLPSPNGWSRGLRRKSLTPFGQRRFLTIVTTMRNMGFITKTQWNTAVTTGDFGRPLSGYTALVDDPAEEEAAPAPKPQRPGAVPEDDEPSPDSDEAIDAGPADGEAPGPEEAEPP